MPDFWPACRYVRDDRNADGSVRIGDDFLRGLWLREEVAPVAESCRNERALHARLLADPRKLPDSGELARIADADVRDNYALLLRFVVRLLEAGSAEHAYRKIFEGGDVDLPPLFIDLLVELILRDMLRDTDDVWQLRAAELLFRRQKVSIVDGVVMVADAEAIDRHVSGKSFGALGKLLVDAKIKPRNIPLDVLNDDNREQYWRRSGAHDMVLAFRYGGPGLVAFCRVLEQWIEKLSGLTTELVPVPAIESDRWGWHIGLDAEATAMLNDLYRGRALSEERQRRLLALFEMRVLSAADLRPEVKDRKIFLACAMAADGGLRIKPQNLLLNMPVCNLSSG